MLHFFLCLVLVVWIAAEAPSLAKVIAGFAGFAIAAVAFLALVWAAAGVIEVAKSVKRDVEADRRMEQARLRIEKEQESSAKSVLTRKLCDDVKNDRAWDAPCRYYLAHSDADR
jgi:hypothetical protein